MFKRCCDPYPYCSWIFNSLPRLNFFWHKHLLYHFEYHRNRLGVSDCTLKDIKKVFKILLTGISSRVSMSASMGAQATNTDRRHDDHRWKDKQRYEHQGSSWAWLQCRPNWQRMSSASDTHWPHNWWLTLVKPSNLIQCFFSLIVSLGLKA